MPAARSVVHADARSSAATAGQSGKGDCAAKEKVLTSGLAPPSDSQRLLGQATKAVGTFHGAALVAPLDPKV